MHKTPPSPRHQIDKSRVTVKNAVHGETANLFKHKKKQQQNVTKLIKEK